MMDDAGVKTIIEWGTTSSFKKLGGLVGKQIREFNASSLVPGTYGLVVFSPEKIPRPGNRNLVQIGLKVHSIAGKEIYDSTFELWLKKSPLVEHEFEIEDKHAPATVTLTIAANNVKVAIEIAANISKLSKNEASLLDFSANYDELCDVVNKNLRERSKQLEEAKNKRLWRPFLYLVALHPQTRGQIATSMDIKVPPGITLYEECLDLLCHPKSGLCDRNKSLSSKIANSESMGHWQFLILGMLEENCLINPAKYAYKTLGDIKEDKDLERMEIDAIGHLAVRSQEVIQEKKVAGEENITELCEHPIIKEQIFANLIKGGINDPVIHRFTIELVLRLRAQNDKRIQEHRKYTPEEVLFLLKDRAFAPISNSMLGNEGVKKAKKAGTIAAKVGFNQFVLMALLPPLGIAFLGYNIADALFGASMNIVSAVVLQLLVQKLLLAAQGIYVPPKN